ncbi:hypothetical protein HY949_02980 [Candidatus Gottesmanbacteria bacterium]|nr:hypothetical protein [Candidatus Gottesmanbacteria bacterium]
MALILLGMIVISLTQTIGPLWAGYTSPYYTDDIYKGFRDAYDGSQYRKKENAGLIPDETVFSYAAGAYVRGVDPILINSEHTPLGKYMIGLFILLMKNDKFIVLPSAILTLIGVWIIGSMALKDKVAALIPVAVLATEPLFLGQIRTAPLLDIIQLPWILFAIAAFLWEWRKGRFLVTAVMIGLVMATKTIIPGILLVMTFVAYLSLQRKWRHIVRLILWLCISIIIFVASYTGTFMSGYTIFDFIGFQKWIFLYQKSKLIFPFSVWKLLLFNQWQAWWGDMSIIRADDWRWTWPVSTLLGLLTFGLLMTKKMSLNKPIALLVLWFAIYSAFLSLGVVSSRFFLPLFPISYIVGVWTIRWGIQKIWR